jgi:hypothetical protein
MIIMRRCLLFVVLCSLGLTAAAQEPATVLRKVEEQLKPILAQLTPPPVVEQPGQTQSLVVRYRPQKFMVHGHSMTGEWSANALERLGPSYTGFVLSVHLQPLGEVNQAVTPQTIQEPYWKTYLNVTPVAGTTNQIYWALSSGSRMDEKVLASLRTALEKL